MDKTFTNNEDIHKTASGVVNRFLDKENLTGPEANAVLAYLKFLRDLNDNTQEEDTNDTFEIQL